MPHIFGTLTANGNSEEFVASNVDFVIGDDSSTFNGTVKIQVKMNSQNDWTTVKELTEAGSHTNVNHFGLRFRLNLSGSTSPVINYAIKY